MIIKNGLVFTLKDGGSFEPLTIETEEDKIIRIMPAGDTNCSDKTTSSGKQCVDATDCYVIPGLIDIHFHGAKGYDFSDGTPSALEAIGKYEFENGITDICPAIMTISEQEIEQVLDSAVTFVNKTRSADLIGIHMEGPFISPDKKGAQNPLHIKNPNPAFIEKWLALSNGLIKLMAIAPEIPGALNCIKAFQSQLNFSIGHTTADYDTALAAISAGATHVTHLYNAMPPLTHRAPGVIGAAADSAHCMVELICDGIHVAPPVIRSTFKLFGDDRVILISDSIRATGMPEGTYTLGGQNVTVQNGKATLTDKTIPDDMIAGGTVTNETIAGSVCNLYNCMIKAVGFGIPLVSAIKAATINPCRSIGVADTLGSINVGKKAHFLLLDKNDLSIKHIIKGQLYL